MNLNERPTPRKCNIRHCNCDGSCKILQLVGDHMEHLREKIMSKPFTPETIDLLNKKFTKAGI